MKRFDELHNKGMEWIPTREIYDIYYTSHGSHVNSLIKLLKSDYLHSRVIETILDCTGPDGVKYPRRVKCRVWRNTEKAEKFLERYDRTDEEWIEYAIHRASNYLRKRDIEYIIIEDELIEFTDYRGEIKRYRFLDLKRGPKWADFYQSAMGYRSSNRGENKEDIVRANKELRAWLDGKTGIVYKRPTPYGVLEIEGGLLNNRFTLDGNYCCVQPSVRIHRVDSMITRLTWLNFDYENLIRLIARTMIMENCPVCRQRRWGITGQRWIFCPWCGAVIEDAVEDFHMKAVSWARDCPLAKFLGRSP